MAVTYTLLTTSFALAPLFTDTSIDARDRDYLVREILGTDNGSVNLDGMVDWHDDKTFRLNDRPTDAGWEHSNVTVDGRADWHDLRPLLNRGSKLRLNPRRTTVFDDGPTSTVTHRSFIYPPVLLRFGIPKSQPATLQKAQW